MISKYTTTETAAFFEEAKRFTHSPKRTNVPQHTFSSRTDGLMKRWKAKALVRELLPTLNNAKDPFYWETVDRVESSLK